MPNCARLFRSRYGAYRARYASGTCDAQEDFTFLVIRAGERRGYTSITTPGKNDVVSLVCLCGSDSHTGSFGVDAKISSRENSDDVSVRVG